MWRGWDSGLDDLIVNYFKDLFMSNGSNSDEIIQCISLKVSLEQNESLMVEF